MRTVDGEPIPRSVPTPGAQYVKSLGGSVWLGAVVIVAERGVADFDLCSFESHVPRVSDVVERDLSFISIILSCPNSSGVARTRPPTVLGQFGARHRIRGPLLGRFSAHILTLQATFTAPLADLGIQSGRELYLRTPLRHFGVQSCDIFRCKKGVLRRVAEKQSHAGRRVAPSSARATDEKMF